MGNQYHSASYITALPPMTYQRPSLERPLGNTPSWSRLRAQMLQRLSFPYIATQQCTWRHNWYTRGMSNTVLSYQCQISSILLTPTIDRDRTVLRRSEPSSRATLMGEQPNPWDLLQPQDVTSRHRGAKPPRRYELLGEISLLSPEYLLSFERWPFHTEPPDHLSLVSYLIDPSVSQSSTLLLICSTHDYQPC